MEKNKDGKIFSLLLILKSFYSEDMPCWPEVMGIYGLELPKKGHRIEWIMPFKDSIFKKQKITYFKNVKIYLIPYTKSENIFIQLISSISYKIRLSLFLTKKLYKKRYDIIQVRDDIIAGLFTIIIKKIFKVKLTFNYSFPFYLFALESYENNYGSIYILLYRKILNKLLMNFVFNNVDFIFPISNEMIDQLKDNKIDENKMFPINLGIQKDFFLTDKNKINKLKKSTLKCLNNDDFIFIYVGVITKIRDPLVILNAFKIVVDEFSNAKLIFVGDGDALECLKEKSLEMKIEENVILTGKVPYWDVPNYISISNVGLSLIHPRKCFYVSSPNKLFEYEAIKKPVIANIEIPEHERVINKSDGGFLTTYKMEEIAKVMMKMMVLSTDKLEKKGENGYNWVMKNRTFEKMANKIEKIYKKILNC